MASTAPDLSTDSLRRGAIVDRPDGFAPTEARSAGRYLYSFDLARGVVRRTAINRSDPSPTIYYALVSPTTPIAARRRFKRLVRPLLATAAVAGFFLLIFPYYPAVEYQLNQQFGAKAADASAIVTQSPVNDPTASYPLTMTNELIIPKIGVDTDILEGPSLNVLLKHEGVWHQTGSFVDSSMVLAGHRFRYLPPNTSTFYNLGKMAPGDLIAVDWYGHRYRFNVTSVTTVPNTDTALLKPGVPGTLILYTCNDWRMTQRIVVTAKLLP
jgi:LPXTG-site transpeptidase (sortase) family protein